MSAEVVASSTQSRTQSPCATSGVTAAEKAVMASFRRVEMGHVKRGEHVLIDSLPCRVVEAKSSAPGKHGCRKVVLVGLDVFTGAKYPLGGPADGGVWAFEPQRVELPVVDADRKTGTVSVLNQMSAVESVEADEAIAQQIHDLVRTGKVVTAIALFAPTRRPGTKAPEDPTELPIHQRIVAHRLDP